MKRRPGGGAFHFCRSVFSIAAVLKSSPFNINLAEPSGTPSPKRKTACSERFEELFLMFPRFLSMRLAGRQDSSKASIMSW
ncbi:hypothetical protein COP00_21915 [Bacillus glycinifermentans]|uniref:Uncharacterized protein n=1 Tax=Bacillus glycinifermentans TaxID=1664069 RepID=A0A0T6BTH8_9BACI|nr:hypothetical protein COP00_21915 [Bacillus glycinifermentans]KRT94518.1 hypothetical protein AB447_214795 [Bacillus glycinifermentans]